jgi:hypothetical protein
MNAHLATDVALCPPVICMTASGAGPSFEEGTREPQVPDEWGDSCWPPRLALLAGGLATRLRPLTSLMPKSLIEVAGEPFLAHQLRLIRAGGIREVVLCCGFLGEQIEDFAGDGSKFGLSITYSHDGPVPLGTGGALLAALPRLGRRFLVMYGERIRAFLPNRADDALNADILVRPGDTVIVPKAGIVYVLGDVAHPGGYVMQNDSQLTVLQAIALAAGASKTASEKNVRLVRNIDGLSHSVDLPLRDMERGRDPDVPLQANDILYVPFSLVKNISLGIANITAAASSALIYAAH